MMKITKSQLRQIIKEEIQNVRESMRLTEAFNSDILRNLSTGYGGMNRQFFSATAKKYGIEWDKIQDYHIEKLKTPRKKGLTIAVAGSNVEYLANKTREYRSQRWVGIRKGQLIAVMKDGKPLYTGSSYRAPEVGTAGEVDSYSKQMVGLDAFGYRSMAAISTIPNLYYYHIDMTKGGEYMRAEKKAELRQAAKYGATKFIDHQEFAKQQKERYADLVRKMKNDPKKIKAMVNKTVEHLDKMMKEVMDVKSPIIKKYIAVVQKEYGENASERFDVVQFKAAGEIANQSSNLYSEYGHYLQEANRSEATRSTRYVDSYAASVVNDCRRILSRKTIDYLRY